MNKTKWMTILSVILILVIAISIITISSQTITNQQPENLSYPENIVIEIADGTIKINIVGDKYRDSLKTYSVITNLGETDIEYDSKNTQTEIPFDEAMTSIKIIGQFSDGTKETLFSGKITKGTVAEPIDPSKIKFTVRFITNGGSEIPELTVSMNDKIVKPADPKRIGYEFSGWYSDSNLTKEYDFDSFVMANTTLYAKWNEVVTVPETEYPYKNQFNSVNKFKYAVNNWFGKDYLVIKEYKVISFKGNEPLNLPSIAGKRLEMLKTSAAMTLAINSAKPYYEDVSQIYLASGGKLNICGGSLILGINEDDVGSDVPIIKIEEGAELVTDLESDIIIRISDYNGFTDYYAMHNGVYNEEITSLIKVI